MQRGDRADRCKLGGQGIAGAGVGALAGLALLATGCELLVGIDDREVGAKYLGDASVAADVVTTNDAGDVSVGEDGAPDVSSPDATEEVGLDTGSEASPDVVNDVSGDVASDVEPDVVSDVGSDVNDGGGDVVDAPIDVGVDVDDGGTDGDGDASTITCQQSSGVASIANSANGPALAYLKDGPFEYWGLVWLESDRSRIWYNAVPSSGSPYLWNQDEEVIAGVTGTAYDTPQLSPLGQKFVLAYGRRIGQPSGPAGTVVNLVDPPTGVAEAGVVGNVETAADAPLVGQVAASPSKIVTTDRRFGFGLTAGRINHFTVGPAHQGWVPLQPDIRASSVAWAGQSNLFGVAVLEDDAQFPGRLYTYPPTFGTEDSFNFTEIGDQPASGSEVATSSADELFVVSWVDERNPNQAVVLTTVDTGTRERQRVDVAAGPPQQKRFPRVVYDGRTVVVAWLDCSDAQTCDLYVDFYNKQRERVYGPMCVTCAAGGSIAAGTIGLAEGGVGNLGVAWRHSSGKQYFTHISCTGS